MTQDKKEISYLKQMLIVCKDFIEDIDSIASEIEKDHPSITGALRLCLDGCNIKGNVIMDDYKELVDADK